MRCFCYIVSDIQELTAIVQQLTETVASEASDMKKVASALDTLRANHTSSTDSADSTDTHAPNTSVQPARDIQPCTALFSTLCDLVWRPCGPRPYC